MSEVKVLSKKLIGDIWDVTVVDENGVEHDLKVDGCKISREEKVEVFKDREEVDRDAISQFISSRT